MKLGTISLIFTVSVFVVLGIILGKGEVKKQHDLKIKGVSTYGLVTKKSRSLSGDIMEHYITIKYYDSDEKLYKSTQHLSSYYYRRILVGDMLEVKYVRDNPKKCVVFFDKKIKSREIIKLSPMSDSTDFKKIIDSIYGNQ